MWVSVVQSLCWLRCDCARRDHCELRFILCQRWWSAVVQQSVEVYCVPETVLRVAMCVCVCLCVCIYVCMSAIQLLCWLRCNCCPSRIIVNCVLFCVSDDVRQRHWWVEWVMFFCVVCCLCACDTIVVLTTHKSQNNQQSHAHTTNEWLLLATE